MRTMAIGSALVLIVLALFVLRPALIDNLDSRVFDILSSWAGPGQTSGQVVIVEIDEASLARYGRWPWPRDVVGRLSRAILDAGASAVALDAMFPQANAATDQAFADAISGKPVVAGYTLTFDASDSASAPCPVPTLPLQIANPAVVFHASGAVCSVPAISQAALASGFLNASPDNDGSYRHVPLMIEYGGRYYPSLALAALNLCRPASRVEVEVDRWGAEELHLDQRAVPLEGRSLLRLRFRGRRRTFPYVSAADVLASRVADGMLRKKLVIVGGTAPGMQNPLATPVDPLFPDVEIQATALDNLLKGDTFRRPAEAPFWEVGLALAAGLIATLMFARFGSTAGAACAVGLVLLFWVGSESVLASGRILVSPLPATLTLVSVLLLLALNSYRDEKRRADVMTQRLSSSRLRSQEILRESESRYRLLVENVNDAITVEDADGRLVFANRRFREWFGMREEEIGSTMMERFVAPEWRAEIQDRNQRRMRGEAVHNQFEFEGVRPDGSRMWIEALVTAIDEDGRIVGSQSALRDATERKRMEAQYLQAQKMESVGRLAGGVAHDFNNLLTVINGYSDMLLTKLPGDDPSRLGLEQIRQAGQRAAELTQKLLAFSRKQKVRTQSVNLNVLVTEAEAMLARVIGEDVHLVTHLSPDLWQVMADPGQINQILMNLVVNARDAMPGGGTVTLETRNVTGEGADAKVYLGISDTGTGMTAEVKNRLFEPFFTTKDQGKGTGLGLATVYGIVNQSGGQIEVTSELGHGTTFHIFLRPVIPTLPEPSEAADYPATLRGVETVLVVEDQDAVRELATRILETYGYRVLKASSGPDALALAESHAGRIHLLLTDIVLPAMNGREVAEKLKASRPDTRVLFISGYPDDRIASEGGGYLSKPFTAVALASKVREVLTKGMGAMGNSGS